MVVEGSQDSIDCLSSPWYWYNSVKDSKGSISVIIYFGKFYWNPLRGSLNSFGFISYVLTGSEFLKRSRWNS